MTPLLYVLVGIGMCILLILLMAFGILAMLSFEMMKEQEEGIDPPSPEEVKEEMLRQASKSDLEWWELEKACRHSHETHSVVDEESQQGNVG